MDVVRKRTNVYLDTIENIIQYQPIDIQRLLNVEHVNNLVEDQLCEYRKYNQFSILQSITCADFNNKRYILDGQHRIEAFSILKNQYNISLFETIPVICYNVDRIEEIKDYYLRINKHHPINPLECSKEWFEYGKNFCQWISTEFKPYIKNLKTKCNCPYINMSELMTYIKEYKVFERLIERNINLETFEQFICDINLYFIANCTIIKNFQINEEYTKKIDKCLEKSSTFTCILGIWRRFEWIEIAIYSITNNIPISEISFSKFCNVRTKIAKKVRMSVWKKRNQEKLVGTCFVCSESLEYENMECGHVTSFANGGSCDLHNLEPICKQCNRDMGTINLIEYVEIHNFQPKN